MLVARRTCGKPSQHFRYIDYVKGLHSSRLNLILESSWRSAKETIMIQFCFLQDVEIIQNIRFKQVWSQHYIDGKGTIKLAIYKCQRDDRLWQINSSTHKRELACPFIVTNKNYSQTHIRWRTRINFRYSGTTHALNKKIPFKTKTKNILPWISAQ